MRGAPGRIAALLKPCRHRVDAHLPVSVLARQPQARAASVAGATEAGAGQHKLLRSVGIVREVYSKWERRVPLCPSHVRELVGDGVSVVVQPSKSRVFSDKEFADAGASVCNDLSECSVILGVKQVPVKDLLPGKTYMFFSHTIKGQEENMPLLDACLKQRVRLVDYECITQGGKPNGKRLIAFGSWAGKAGMINALRGLGERFLAQGFSTPFLNIGSAYMYGTYEDARSAILKLGEAIRTRGLPEELAPLVFVFTSNGKASKGAQEVFELLPHQWVHPSELASLPKSTGHLFGCVVTAEDVVRHRQGNAYDREEYYTFGKCRYVSTFADDVAPYTTALVNCTYWDERYPRLLTTSDMQRLHEGNQRKLAAVADISCDVGGSVQFLERSTAVEKPFYLYNVAQGCAQDDLDGDGVLMMGVDILPSELPREASTHFGDLLVNLVRPLLECDAHTEWQGLHGQLPPALHHAIITNNGQLAPRFEYLGKLQDERERMSSTKSSPHAGDSITHVALRGHLFDTGLINKALDLIEEHRASFVLQECSVHPNHSSASASLSRAVIQVGSQDRAGLDKVVQDLEQLVAATSSAQATLTELAAYEGATGPPPNSMKDPAARSVTSKPTHHQRRKRVVCLGAGMVSAPLVEFLSRDSTTAVEVVSGVEGQAQQLANQMRRSNVSARTLDVLQDSAEVQEMCSAADCVVSLLPASMHVPIAEACIRTATPLVTASYVSADMQALHLRAVEAGVPILCEMGLDPGMDHMSAMKMMDEAKKLGGSITSFASWCGGLPAPEAAGNPLRYKFSWSPRGVLAAAQNKARYLRDGAVVEVPGRELLQAAEPVDFLKAFAFEALPNRDSLQYKDKYNLGPNVEHLYRGTLRFSGFSAIMNEMREIGLLESQAALLPGSQPCPRTWAELMASDLIRPTDGLSAETLHCLEWLGLWSDTPLVRKRGWAVVDEFCALLEQRLSYAPGERDMVAMHHKIGVAYPDGSQETRTCTLVGYGEIDGASFMASTVGLTAAAGAHLILTEQLLTPGVITPTIAEVYEPALQLLRQEGIKFEEHVSRRRHAPPGALRSGFLAGALASQDTAAHGASGL